MAPPKREIPLFLLLIINGVGIHVTDEFARHEAWHCWAVTHVAAAVKKGK